MSSCEANVPYDEVFELEEINSGFLIPIGFVIGANILTSGKTDKASPIYGMPILMWRILVQFFVKRSMASGMQVLIMNFSLEITP